MKGIIEQFSFQKPRDKASCDYLDIKVHPEEGWLEIFTSGEDNESFPIESQSEIDEIYEKLTELLKVAKSTSRKKRTKKTLS